MKTTSIYKTPDSQSILMQRYDEFLAGWPVAAEKIEVATSFGKTFVLAWGNPQNPPLVLLHGSMANSAAWAGDAVPFDRHFRVYAVDLPGEPGHSEPRRLDLNSPEPAQWLNQVLDGLGITNTNLLGISMGGFYALRFTADYKERVKKLVLLCPGGVTPQRLSFLWHFLKYAIFGAKGGDGAARLVYGNIEVAEEAVAYTRLIAAHFNPVPVVPILSDKTLAHIHAPTLMIAGDQDVMLNSVKSIKRLEKILPDFRSVLLPGVSHVVIGQAERVIAFLQE